MAKKQTQAAGADHNPSYRLQIRLADDWREAVESAAAEAGVSPSEFARNALAKALPREVRQGLSDMRRGRPSADVDG